MTAPQKVLVTGATGYVGGRLIPQLLDAGHEVRAMARRPEHLRDRPWAADTDIVTGDVFHADQVAAALTGIDTAYYLVHSMGSGDDFDAQERHAARLFASTARAQGVKRIIYLGGLHPEQTKLSKHLASRTEVGHIFLASGVPTIVLQAAVILGSGSASFEMMRYITERLPVMVAPRWVKNRVQPIAIRDVLRYLVKSLDLPAKMNRAFDIGGPSVLPYVDMMRVYSEVAKLPRRRVIALPVLTPRLASHWINLVTPLPGGLAKPLVESLVHEVICTENDIRQYIPDPPGGLLTARRSIQLALERHAEGAVPTSFSTATNLPSHAPHPEDPQWSGGDLYVDDRTTEVEAPAQLTWEVVEGIGGERGWYSWRFGWQVRGILDRLVGGPGLRRGRRDPDKLRLGDALDWWRVQTLERGTLLRLSAEMLLPGDAWLEFWIEEHGATRSQLRQRALFYPRGLAGRLYWLAVTPFHAVVFGPMLRDLTKEAENRATQHLLAGNAVPHITNPNSATKPANTTPALPQ